MLILFPLLNALSVAAGNVLGGVATRRQPLALVMVVSAPVSLAISLALALVDGNPPASAAIGVGMLAGAIGGIGLPLAYRAFAIGPAGVAGSIVACVSTGLLASAGIATGTSASPSRLAGLAVCTGAVILVSLRGKQDSPPTSRVILPAVLAGAAFAGFALILNTAQPGAGSWPVFGVRLGVVGITVVLFLVTAAIRGRRALLAQVTPTGVLLSAAVGVMDATGNLFLLLALRGGDLVLVALLTSTAPIYAALLAWLLLKERLSRTQFSGLALAAVGLALAAV